jgi:hypothetical protein
MQESVKFAAPAVPGNGATITLWSSIDAFGPRRMRLVNFSMLEILFVLLGTNGSAANGLVPQTSDDGGVNWRGMDFKNAAGTPTMPVAVAALAAGANTLHRFVVNNVNDFRVQFIADAAAPVTWQLEITGIFGALAVAK